MRRSGWIGVLAASVVSVVPLAVTSGVAAAVDQRFVIPIGAPLEDVAGRVDAGAVTFVPRDGGNGDLWVDRSFQIDESDVGGVVRAGNEFGSAIALGDVDGDGDQDLVIGAPGADADRGRVYVVPFAAPTQRFNFGEATLVRQGAAGIAGSSEAGDRFGSSIVIGQNFASTPWVAIGVPGENVGTIVDAGAVSIVPNGTSGVGDVQVWQGSGAPGTAETGDRFGTAIAPYFHTTNNGIAVGVPFEDVRRKRDAGEVDLLFATAPGGLPGSAAGRAVHENRGGGPGRIEAGDRFGSAVVAIYSDGGVGQFVASSPYDDVAGRIDAGTISIYRGETDTIGLQYSQHSAGIPDTAEAGDRFGASLAYTNLSLTIGVPGEETSTATNAGAIHVLYAVGGNPFLPANGDFFTQNTPGVPDRNRRLDEFGAFVQPSNQAIVVSAPGKSIGSSRSGSVTVFFMDNGWGHVIAAGSTLIHQDTPGVPGVAEPGDRFGGSLTITPTT